LYNTWNGCTSLVTAAVPDTSGWGITGSIGALFLANTWQNCSSLSTAVISDMEVWNIHTIGNNFMNATWYGCAGVRDISTIRFPDALQNMDSFYDGSVTSLTNKTLVNTFALEGPGSYTGDPPSFYNGTLITWRAPNNRIATFTYRTGMNGYDPAGPNAFDANWK
jgi:hypothetical protein